MSTLTGKHVLLGVSGGIAAYKSPDLVRRLRAAGAAARVALTTNATRFVTPLTFQAVSGQPVHESLLDAGAESAMGHIELARWADVVLVAPATANFLARLAHGFADDLLTTLCLATAAPVAVAPAMNQQMWTNHATRDNLRQLESRGIHVFGPGEGDQACGETGPGRMLEPAELVTLLEGLFEAPLLAGRRVLITAGPTWEAIDPVRGITNHSSGRMGYAVAEAAAAAGAAVTLVSGPTALSPPASARSIPVGSAVEMHRAVMDHVREADIFIAVAAVADYRPARRAEAKIKKDAVSLAIELVRNPDILAEVAALPDPPFTVGFAAETDDLIENAGSKLRRKGVNLVAANPVGQPGSGFSGDRNNLTLVAADGVMALGEGPKRELARRLVREIARRYAEHRSGPHPRFARGG